MLRHASMELRRMSTPDNERTGRRLAARLGELRASFMRRVHEVNAMTAREVMSAASSVNRVVDAASSHVARVKQLIASLDGGGEGRSGMTGAIARQTTALEEFFENASSDIALQEAASARAQDQLQRITKAASDTSRLSSAARLLALNARIEAGRVGGNGNCFSTIAGEMQHLAEQITQANQLIDALAASLSRDLPEMASRARSLRESSETLNATLSVTTQEVRRETDLLKGMIGATLSESDAAMEHILEASHSTLSNLQFQDAVAQGLLRFEASFVTEQEELARAFDLSDVLAEIPPPEHVEIGGEKAVDAANAGELMMF
jgi:methyl-accepting chemotaxis protein